MSSDDYEVLVTDLLQSVVAFRQRPITENDLVGEVIRSLERHLNRNQTKCSACSQRMPGLPYGIAYIREWTLIRQVDGRFLVLCPEHNPERETA